MTEVKKWRNWNEDGIYIRGIIFYIRQHFSFGFLLQFENKTYYMFSQWSVECTHMIYLNILRS